MRKSQSHLDLFGWGALVLASIYTAVMAFFQPQVFTDRFEPSLIDRYWCSQDIPYEPPCKRLFLSDSEIHIAAGYLYWNGSSPAVVNFQHPPLAKYGYGLMTIVFNNPLIFQFIVGLLCVQLTFLLSWKVLEISWWAVVPPLLLVTDRLFLQVAGAALLDLSQLLFALVIIYLYFYRKNAWVLGLSIGLMAASKFWTPAALLTVLLLILDTWKHKQLQLLTWSKTGLAALLTTYLLYLPAFWNPVSLLIFELKVFKYWVHQTTAVTGSWGEPFLLFITGYYQHWWAEQQLVREATWSILWPVSLLATAWQLIRTRKRPTLTILIATFSILYLLLIGSQSPFARYLLLVLPFIYISLTQVLQSLSKGNK